MFATEIDQVPRGHFFPGRDRTVLNRKVVDTLADVLLTGSVHPRRIAPDAATWRLDLPNWSLFLSTYFKGKYANRSGILVPDYVAVTEPDSTHRSLHSIRGLIGVEWTGHSVTFFSDGSYRNEDRIKMTLTRDSVTKSWI